MQCDWISQERVAGNQSGRVCVSFRAPQYLAAVGICAIGLKLALFFLCRMFSHLPSAVPVNSVKWEQSASSLTCFWLIISQQLLRPQGDVWSAAWMHKMHTCVRPLCRVSSAAEDSARSWNRGCYFHHTLPHAVQTFLLKKEKKKASLLLSCGCTKFRTTGFYEIKMMCWCVLESYRRALAQFFFSF